MPIEIKELVIRAVVDDDRADDEPPPAPSDLVERCVREVLRVLARAEER